PDNEYIENIILGNRKEHKKSSLIISPAELNKLAEILPSIVKKTEPFINDCLKEVIAIRPKIVGFSSTFQQQLASLALAMRIKENIPETLIVFGGANCEGEMGLEMIKKFPFIDVIVSGEGDEVFPEIVD